MMSYVSYHVAHLGRVESRCEWEGLASWDLSVVFASTTPPTITHKIDRVFSLEGLVNKIDITPTRYYDIADS